MVILKKLRHELWLRQRRHPNIAVRFKILLITVVLLASLSWTVFNNPQAVRAANISAVTATATTAGTATATTFTINSPTGTTTGDVLVAAVGSRSVQISNIYKSDTTLPFTNLFSDNNASYSIGVWYRVVQPGDPTTWTVNTTTDAQVDLMAYRGVDNITPIDSQGTKFYLSTTTITFNAVTTLSNNARYIGAFMTASNGTGNNLTTFTSGTPTPTKRGDDGNAGGSVNKASVALIDAPIATAGSSGTYNYTTGVVAGTTWAFALRPAFDPAPTLSLPANGSIGVSSLPQFQLRTSDVNNDYLRYKIEVCSTNNCSSILRTIDQTASQTGWSGQDLQTSTAYTGNSVISSSTLATHTYQATALSYCTQYWWRGYAIDPGGSNNFSSASSIYTFTTNCTPSAPTLSQPVSGLTGVSATPELRLYSTDTDSDYLQYWIDVCSTSNCSSIVRSICQTNTGTGVPGTCSSPSQTGWLAQSLLVATAYSAGQQAVHNYQATALAANTQYWWRAYVIDPGGTNIWSSASSIFTFTIAATSNTVIIKGGTSISGNVILNP